MLTKLRFVLLLPLVALFGCSVAPSTTTSNPSLPLTGNWDNWQIQAGTAITSPPNTYPSFTGAIQIQGTTVSAALVTTDSAPISFSQAYTGTYSASTGVVAFSPSGVVGGASLSFTLPSSPYTVTAVNGVIDCGICNNGMLFNGVGVEIAPLTGTYAGTLADDASPSMSGAASLTLTQSTSPNSDGAFPLTGTITFPSSTRLGSAPLNGFVQGEAVTLSWCAFPGAPPGVPNGPCVGLIGSAAPDATQITITTLSYAGTTGSIIATYTGTLTHQ